MGLVQLLHCMSKCADFIMRKRADHETFLTFSFWFVSARICEAVQAGGPVDAAGRVQMAEETLSQSAPALQRLLQTARHHRYCLTLVFTCTVEYFLQSSVRSAA